MTKRNGDRTAVTLALPFMVIIGSALGVAGCTSQSAVEGPPCDETAIQSALKSGADGSDESVFSIDDITCADGWAVAFPTVGVTEDVAFTITAVFRADGQSWVEVDRTADEVCGTDDPNEDPMNPVYPDDAQVPESLWQDACRTN